MQGVATEAANQQAEILPLAQHPVDYVHGQAAIICRQSALFGQLLKERFHRGTSQLQSAECFNGCIAGGLLASRRFGGRSGHDDGLWHVVEVEGN